MSLRTIGKGAGGFFLAVFLSLTIVSTGLVSLTNEDNLRPAVIEIYSQQILGENVEQSLVDICGTDSSTTVNLTGNVIFLNCDKIRERNQTYISGVTANVTNLGEDVLGAKFDEIYNAEYDCDFIACLQKEDVGFMALVSKKGNEFLQSVFSMLVVLSLISAAVLFVSSKGWGRLKSFGASLIFVGILYPVFIVSGDQLTSAPLVGSLAQIILDSIIPLYLIVLIAGIVLMILGYVGPRKFKFKK